MPLEKVKHPKADPVDESIVVEIGYHDLSPQVDTVKPCVVFDKPLNEVVFTDELDGYVPISKGCGRFRVAMFPGGPDCAFSVTRTQDVPAAYKQVKFCTDDRRMTGCVLMSEAQLRRCRLALPKSRKDNRRPY